MSNKLTKITMSVAALAALAAGGAAFANAQGGAASTPAASPTSVDAPEPGDTPDRPGDANEAADRGEQVTGAAADKAKQAALSAVGSGRVTDLSRETHDDQGGAADTPEPGDTPDPGYESRIAYDVEVTKADGTAVDVHLDKGFSVLGTDKADQGDHGHDGRGDGDGENPNA